ncbi:MAG TPA: dihydropteroate synthase [Patescibacteria group bacterium]|nr:dihydropteroate synthase [Patescibacteria group bacterium]
MGHVQLVGILNCTPDSFSDGGLYLNPKKALAHAEQLFANGANIVDVGAESTNPKSASITPDEEWARLRPILEGLLPAFSDNISIDTHHPTTLERIVDLFGDCFIANDVTGMNDPQMRNTVARYKLRCIISHLPARFGTDIQAAHADATMDDEQEVLQELLSRREQLLALGLSREHIILDPGIGFGKTMALNHTLLTFARLIPDSKVMIGYSRKRFLGEHRFETEPNIAAGKLAISAGAAYLRVHDVAAHARLLPK